MDKKQRISWGVSFGSIALVAGMVSYLGLTNGFKSNNAPAAKNQQFNQNADETNQSLFGNDNFNNNPDNNGFSDDNNNSFNNGNSFDNGNGSFGNGPVQGGFGRHSRHQGGGFDTTTGGT